MVGFGTKGEDWSAVVPSADRGWTDGGMMIGGGAKRRVRVREGGVRGVVVEGGRSTGTTTGQLMAGRRMNRRGYGRPKWLER
jgi:hypothetical protein